MSGLAFLLIALAISVVGSLLLWARTRRPGSVDSGIDAFRREMRALSPHRGQGRVPEDGRGRRRPG